MFLPIFSFPITSKLQRWEWHERSGGCYVFGCPAFPCHRIYFCVYKHEICTTLKVSVFGVTLVRIFPHLD